MSATAARWSSVSRTSTGAALRAASCSESVVSSERRMASQAIVVDLDRLARGPPALPIPRDHPDLEREQLVEGEPGQRAVLGLRVVREVGVLDGSRDARRRGVGAGHVARSILRVGGPDLVERAADGAPEDRRGDALGQAVDRHDATRVERLATDRAEDRALEDGHDRLAEAQGDTRARRRPLDLDLARDDHLLAREEAALDVLATEPDGLGAAALVLQPGADPMDATPHGRLDGDVDDPDPGRDRLARRLLGQSAERHRRPEVVVPAGQVEEEVADRLDAQAPEPPGDRRRRKAAPDEGCLGRRAHGDAASAGARRGVAATPSR